MRHVAESSASTLVMVRTSCCATYKCTGSRCSICPQGLRTTTPYADICRNSHPGHWGAELALPPSEMAAEA